MAGSLPPVAGAVFDERRKALGFSVAVGSRAVTVAFARSEDPGLVLPTVPFIGRERGENSGALWRPHSGHKFGPEGRPPSPRSSPQWGRGCTPVAWRCWPAQGHWRRSNPVRSRSRARARPWPKCPTCHSRHVAFVRAPHRLNGHGPCFYLGAGLVYVLHVWRTQYSGSHRFPSGTPFPVGGRGRRAHSQSGGGFFCLGGPKGVGGVMIYNLSYT